MGIYLWNQGASEAGKHSKSEVISQCMQADSKEADKNFTHNLVCTLDTADVFNMLAIISKSHRNR